MKVMSGLDARFLYSETPTAHMHTMKVVVVDVSGRSGPLTPDLLAVYLADRLDRMPMLRRRVVPVLKGLGNPAVIDDPYFDLARHLKVATLPPPGGQRELDEVIALVASRPLPLDRPLWELTVVDGFADGRVAAVMKMHHAIADGVASAAMLENAFLVDADQAVVEHYHPEAVPTRRQKIKSSTRSAGRAVRLAPRVAKDTFTGTREALRIRRESTAQLTSPFSGPRAPFNVALTADRTFATLTLPLETVLALKASAGVTFNDTFLALAGGGIRRYLERFGPAPAKSLVASVPMATRTDRHRLGGNHVDNLFVPLRTDLADPDERAKAIHESTIAARKVREAFGPELFELRSGMVPAGFHGVFPRLWGATHLADHFRPPLNVIASCVRGPGHLLEVEGGVVSSLFSCGPILEGIGLNITAWSYVDSLFVSFLGCSASLPDPWLLAGDLQAEMDAWAGAT